MTNGTWSRKKIPLLLEWFVVRRRQKQLRETTHQSDDIKKYVQQLSHLYHCLKNSPTCICIWWTLPSNQSSIYRQTACYRMGVDGLIIREVVQCHSRCGLNMLLLFSFALVTPLNNERGSLAKKQLGCIPPPSEAPQLRSCNCFCRWRVNQSARDW